MKPQPLDPELLASLRRKGVLTGVARIFLEHAPPLLAGLRRALAAGDARACQWDAHRFRGSSGSLGAFRLSRLCHELEALASEGDLAACREKLEEIELEHERVATELREILGEPSRRSVIR